MSILLTKKVQNLWTKEFPGPQAQLNYLFRKLFYGLDWLNARLKLPEQYVFLHTVEVTAKKIVHQLTSVQGFVESPGQLDKLCATFYGMSN
jgi:hypothetical protein